MANVIQITWNFKKQLFSKKKKKSIRRNKSNLIPPFHELAKSLSEDNKSIEVAT